MLVYRLSSTKFANDLTGTGAKINGGRWNHVGVAAAYGSGSRALAVLEYSVNNEIFSIPRALTMVTIDTGRIPIQEIMEKDLPGDWKKLPAPSSTRDFGSKWLLQTKKAILKIPSTIVAEEFNYLLNPGHPDFQKIKIAVLSNFVYDLRIKST